MDAEKKPATPEVASATPEVPAAASSTTTPGASAVNPGHGLGIASLILSIVGVGLVGIILGAIGLSKSKKAGQSNGLAIAGIIVGIISTIVVTIICIVIIGGIVLLANTCADLGPGTHVIDGGATVTCGY